MTKKVWLLRLNELDGSVSLHEFACDDDAADYVISRTDGGVWADVSADAEAQCPASTAKESRLLYARQCILSLYQDWYDGNGTWMRVPKDWKPPLVKHRKEKR